MSLSPRLLPVVVLPVALLAGCSGSSTGSSPAPVGPSTSPPAGTPSTAASAFPTAAPAQTATDPAPTSSASATAAGLGLCSTAQLALSVQQGDSGAGSGHQILVLRNTGSQRCTLNGHPGVSFVNAQGSQVGRTAAREGTPSRVLLAPGGRAYALLTYVSILEAVSGCEDSSARTTADRVRVYPPDQRAALYASDHLEVCLSPGADTLRIGPVTASSPG